MRFSILGVVAAVALVAAFFEVTNVGNTQVTKLKKCVETTCQGITGFQCDCNGGDECDWTGNTNAVKFCGKNSEGNCGFDPMTSQKCEKGICKVLGNFCTCEWPKCF